MSFEGSNIHKQFCQSYNSLDASQEFLFFPSLYHTFTPTNQSEVTTAVALLARAAKPLVNLMRSNHTYAAFVKQISWILKGIKL